MDKTLNTLGIAARAKKLIYGSEMLKTFDKVKLLIIANDISIKSKERFMKKCHFYNVPVIEDYDSETISRALGKRNVKAVGLTDEGFKKTILTK